MISYPPIRAVPVQKIASIIIMPLFALYIIVANKIKQKSRYFRDVFAGWWIHR